MATYYVVCINKHPYHADPHTQIQCIGTNTELGLNYYTKKWSIEEVIIAIRRGNNFYCSDSYGDLVKVIIAVHEGHEYIKTEPDGIRADNLLAKLECTPSVSG